MQINSNLDQSYIKQHNIQRVLSILELCQPLTRTEIARITEMSPTSITRIIGALLSLGLVDEVSTSSVAGRGRKAVNLRTRADGIYTLGFHVDLHTLRMCVLNFDNVSCYTATAALPDGPSTPDGLACAARALAEQIPAGVMEDPARLRAVGVGISGRVDPMKGIVARSEALNWTDVPLSQTFESIFQMPVRIENDVKACLTWERVLRALPDDQDVAYLYIGRAGIGFASTSNGAIVRGMSSSAGEIERLHLLSDDRLDKHLMEESLVTRARAVCPDVHCLGDILAAYRLEISWAQILMHDFAEFLSLLLRLVRGLLDPHLVILGGDVPEALAGMPELLPSEPFIPGEHFEDSCALGAAVVAMRESVQQLIGSVIGD